MKMKNRLIDKGAFANSTTHPQEKSQKISPNITLHPLKKFSNSSFNFWKLPNRKRKSASNKRFTINKVE